MTDQDYAYISNHAMFAATVVYALAMVAHVVEWARARQLPAVSSPAGRATAVRSDAVSSGALSSAAVSSGVSSSGISASGVSASLGGAPPVLEPPVLQSPPLPPRVLPQPAVPSRDLGDAVEESDRFGRIGLSLTVLGLIIHAGGVVTRGLEAHRVPWGNMYEFAITGAFWVAVAYLVLVVRYRVRWLGALVTGFLTLVLGLAVTVLYRPVTPLVPALHSYWLYIHVSAAAIASGAFTVGALASVLFLLRSRAEARSFTSPDLPRRGFIWRMPPAEAIDRVAYRVHAFAFPLWTFAVMAGAIWAQYAWGRFWGWDPKETWAFITWVAYAAYLHARATIGWRGRAAAYVALLGYATFLFNFIGINLFGSGLHSYSGM